MFISLVDTAFSIVGHSLRKEFAHTGANYFL